MAPKKKSGGKKKGKKDAADAEDKPDHPYDIMPLVLTSATQEIFGCIVDIDVTAEKPYKLLDRESITYDLRTRAAVSDFSPAKQYVLSYPEEEMLLVFDRAFTYGQCFYLVLTPEGKKRILSPPKSEADEELVHEVVKTPEVKHWESFGSCLEIEAESVKVTREKLRFKFSRVRRKFEAPVCFSDRALADIKKGHITCASYQDRRFSIKHIQCDRGIQAVASVQTGSTQTLRTSLSNTFTQYAPREFNTKEKESLLQLQSVRKFCHAMTPRVIQALQQREIMNVFDDDWRLLGIQVEGGDWTGKVSEGLMLYQAFTDQQYSKDKRVSCVNWHPTIFGVIAVALAQKKDTGVKEATPFNKPSIILFFSFSDPCNPQLVLECPDDILVFEFCPSDPNIIVGGCINGQLVLWDISAQVPHLQSSGKKVSANKFDLAESTEKTPVVHYCAMSALESRHKAPITDIRWLPSTFEVTKTGTPIKNRYNLSIQIITCSPDCTLMFWDLRAQKQPSQSSEQPKVDQKKSSVPDTFKHLDRTWKPLFRVTLPKIESSGEYAPLKFNLEQYTLNSNHTEEESEHEEGFEATRDYSQMKMFTGKSPTPLEDVNTKVYIGTEDGEVLYTDWRLQKDESGRMQASKPLWCFSVHHWLVNTVQRSPFLKNTMLTTGDSNFAIWRENVLEGPIILSPNSEQMCTAACWSPSRPAVFYIGKEDGRIEVWNLLEKTSEPAFVQEHITNAKITCIEPWVAFPKQHFLAVTDEQGTLRVLEIPKNLRVASRGESIYMERYFRLEENVLKDFLLKQDLWEKEKPEAPSPEATEPAKKGSPVESDEAGLKEYTEHQSLEKGILKETGLFL
ncbi:dynein axonemal intermediate chain 3 [Nelusetta ayraudi]|uniref:dynein axonemal intermediate chain 3 n=1 Tax=Nelusetta ayraudi TaxID=303726 RepID=UPI003F721872